MAGRPRTTTAIGPAARSSGPPISRSPTTSTWPRIWSEPSISAGARTSTACSTRATRASWSSTPRSRRRRSTAACWASTRSSSSATSCSDIRSARRTAGAAAAPDRKAIDYTPRLRRIHLGAAGGPDAFGCFSCHSKGGPDGAGTQTQNAFMRGDGERTGGADQRNPPSRPRSRSDRLPGARDERRAARPGGRRPRARAGRKATGRAAADHQERLVRPHRRRARRHAGRRPRSKASTRT